MTADDDQPASGDEYPISPDIIEEDAEELAKRERARQLLARHAAELDQPPDEHATRFSLAWIFILMTGAAVVLALGRQMKPEVFAGTCGAAVLVTLVLISALRVRWVVIHVAWWLLLGIYLLASALAVAQRGQ